MEILTWRNAGIATGFLLVLVAMFLFAMPIVAETTSPDDGGVYFTSPEDSCIENMEFEGYSNNTAEVQVYGYWSEVKTCSYTVDNFGDADSFIGRTYEISEGEFNDNDILTLDLGFK